MKWATFLTLGTLGGLAAGCGHHDPTSPGHLYRARDYMVKYDIESRGVRNKKVLNAMYKVERHLFVPAELRADAYKDCPLPIGHGQTISQPYIVALMTQWLELKGGEKVLEIGTGSGYQSAILAEICKEVYSVEIIEPLAKEADARFKKLGYKNIFIRTGDGYKGWPEAAPFDGILVTCSPNHVPKPLIDQLKIGGHMVIPVDEGSEQALYQMVKTATGLEKNRVVPVRFVPMTGEAQGTKHQ